MRASVLPQQPARTPYKFGKELCSLARADPTRVHLWRQSVLNLHIWPMVLRKAAASGRGRISQGTTRKLRACKGVQPRAEHPSCDGEPAGDCNLHPASLAGVGHCSQDSRGQEIPGPRICQPGQSPSGRICGIERKPVQSRVFVSDSIRQAEPVWASPDGFVSVELGARDGVGRIAVPS